MATKRVLIVDDDGLIRQLLRDMLEMAEYHVLEASDGLEGLQKAEALHPDVILLDLMMPGLDGYGVCRELKAKPATLPIPVIFVTASQDLGLNRLAYAVGAVACLPKPFRREALVAIIESALASAERQASAAKEGAAPKPDPRLASPLPAGN